MTIRPVDMQVFVPKVTEVSRQQQIQQHQGQAEQQFQSAVNQQTAEHKEQSVSSTQKSDQGTIRDDGQRQRQREGTLKRRRSNERESSGDQTEQKPVNGQPGHHLDVRI